MEERMQKITKETAEKIAKLVGEEVLTDDDGNIMLKGQRFVMMGVKYFPYGLGGKNALRPVLYQLGERMGEQFFEHYAELSGDKSRAMEMVFGMMVYQGFGTFEVIDEGDDKMIIRFHNSFEVASYKANNNEDSDTPVCHLTRGFLGGVYSTYFGKRTSVEEILCAATGRQDYCEFEVKIPKK